MAQHVCAAEPLPRYILGRPLGNVELIPAWLMNAGFTCIANALKGVKTPPTSQGVQGFLGVASEQLRLLAHVAKLARDNPTVPPVRGELLAQAGPLVGPEQATHHAGPTVNAVRI
jgi:hypothetical protein